MNASMYAHKWSQAVRSIYQFRAKYDAARSANDCYSKYAETASYALGECRALEATPVPFGSKTRTTFLLKGVPAATCPLSKQHR